MLSYPVRLIPTAAGKVKATFPDVPGASAEGNSEDEAMFQAKFVLEMTLGHLVVQGRPLPTPSDICGAPVVTTEKFEAGKGGAERELEPATE